MECAELLQLIDRCRGTIRRPVAVGAVVPEALAPAQLLTPERHVAGDGPLDPRPQWPYPR